MALKGNYSFFNLLWWLNDFILCLGLSFQVCTIWSYFFSWSPQCFANVSSHLQIPHVSLFRPICEFSSTIRLEFQASATKGCQRHFSFYSSTSFVFSSFCPDFTNFVIMPIPCCQEQYLALSVLQQDSLSTLLLSTQVYEWVPGRNANVICRLMWHVCAPLKWSLARMLPRELRRCTMSAGLILI